MNSRQRNILISSALLAGGAVGAFYLYNKNKDTKTTTSESKVIGRELVIRILKEIDREMFSVLSNISMISNQIKEQSRGRVSHNEIKDFLLRHSKNPPSHRAFFPKISNRWSNYQPNQKFVWRYLRKVRPWRKGPQTRLRSHLCWRQVPSKTCIFILIILPKGNQGYLERIQDRFR